MNWDAFWDSITGLIELPERLVIIGWQNIIEILPNDAMIMEELLTKFNQEYPDWRCDVEYI